LQINADAFTEMDDSNCPTGKILSVEGTAMDFRQPTRIGERIDHDFFARTHGIDANWVVSRDSLEKRLSLVATLSAAGRTMQVRTTAPGLQVYTANFVEENIGKSGTMYHPQNAICLETQNYPDAPNHPSFPSAILRPGEIYFSQTEYKFLS
jgi:aldose 1-epimerase